MGDLIRQIDIEIKRVKYLPLNMGIQTTLKSKIRKKQQYDNIRLEKVLLLKHVIRAAKEEGELIFIQLNVKEVINAWKRNFNIKPGIQQKNILTLKT